MLDPADRPAWSVCGLEFVEAMECDDAGEDQKGIAVATILLCGRSTRFVVCRQDRSGGYAGDILFGRAAEDESTVGCLCVPTMGLWGMLQYESAQVCGLWMHIVRL